MEELAKIFRDNLIEFQLQGRTPKERENYFEILRDKPRAMLFNRALKMDYLEYEIEQLKAELADLKNHFTHTKVV